MNTICTHAQSQNIVCRTCKMLLCIDCVLNKSSGHCHHDNITFSAIVSDHRLDTVSKKNYCVELLNNSQQQLSALTSQKNNLSARNTDNDLVLSHCNSTCFDCDIHSIKCETICATCQKLVCIRCIVGSSHRDHQIEIVADYLPVLRSKLNEKINLINNQIITHNKIIEQNEQLLTELSAEISDKEIIDKYLSVNIHTTLPTFNELYPIEFAKENGLIWSGQYKLFTTNATHFLTRGYYLMIAVGGGGAGGIKLEYKKNEHHHTFIGGGGGGSGYITANVVKVVTNTHISIKVGTGGCNYDYYDCVRISKNNFNYQKVFSKENYRREGLPSSIIIDNLKIMANPGESPFELIYNNNGSINVNKTLDSMKDTFIYRPIENNRFVHNHYLIYMYGGKGFSGGGHINGSGGMGGNRGTLSCLSDRVSKYDPNKDYHHNDKIVPITWDTMISHEKCTNGSKSNIITTINEIFPLVYSGKGGFFNYTNMFYPYPQYCGSRVGDITNLIMSPGCGGGGLCLANHHEYLSNGQKLSQFEEMIASQGFGAGGRGIGISAKQHDIKISDGSNGADGCVIVVSLV